MHLRKLTRRQKAILTKMNKDPKNYLSLKKDFESFTLVDIRTMKPLNPIRY